MSNIPHHTVGVIGGGISGATVAICLGEQNIDTVLFEKNYSLISGPPMCHLHAGGNLYREISDQQCIELLKQSIDVAKLYPEAIDYRPTVIAIPKKDKGTPQELIPRLKLLQKEYQNLIKQDADNQALGNPDNYYRAYEKEELCNLKERDCVKKPTTLDEWMIAFAKITDLEQLQYPVFLVQEYGWNIFRVAATVTIALENRESCKVHLQTAVTMVKNISQQKDLRGNWLINFGDKNVTVDYLINACGYETGKIDDMVEAKQQRMVEFKAAYIAHWKNDLGAIPEIIFHGKRGTPNGMAQLTPYSGNYFQIHGMTEDITLFENGLVATINESSQPKLDDEFIKRIKYGWSKQAIEERTKRAIRFMAQYIPSFQSAVVGGSPLFGAQQIPGNDADLRVADVSFEQHYARCETVKASSVLSAADAILKRLEQEHIAISKNQISTINLSFDQKDITEKAEKLACGRKFPIDLAHKIVSKR